MTLQGLSFSPEKNTEHFTVKIGNFVAYEISQLTLTECTGTLRGPEAPSQRLAITLWWAVCQRLPP